MKIRDARKLSAEAQEDLRIKAVYAVLNGRRQTDVAEIFCVSRQIVGKWVKAYKIYGIQGLKAKRKGPRRGTGVLTFDQQVLIIQLLLKYRPDRFLLPFNLWTREAVGQLIEQKLNVRLSSWTISRYLKRWGFGVSWLDVVSHREKETNFQRWLKKIFPEIKSRARRENATIYWVYEKNVYLDFFSRNHRKAAERILPHHFPVNGTQDYLISATSKRGQYHFIIFEKNGEKNMYLSFLKLLTRQINRKVFLIVDWRPDSASRDTLEWLDQNADKITLFFLPG
ncbi:MAG: IS630 family transposase [bacterium]